MVALAALGDLCSCSSHFQEWGSWQHCPEAASCAVGQRDTPLAPEDVWSHDVYCHSHTLSTWGFKELTLGLLGQLEAGWLPSVPGLVMLRRAPRIPPPPFRTITLTQCSGRGGPSQCQVPFHAGDVDTSCTAGSSTFSPS